MKIDVKKVARLANLPLDPEEEAKYSRQLSKILDYIEQLNQCSTSDVEPTYNVSGNFNEMRPDELGKCEITQEEALQNGPQVKEGFFVTKGVFGEK